jgi:sugar phosphate permease
MAGGVKAPRSSTVRGEALVLWTLWLTYGSFYFCRNNLGVALPGIEADLGYDKKQMGTVLASLKLAYGAGQFINGQLAEKISPRKLLAIGMLASAALNVLFGFGTAFYFLLFVWACNGYAQSLGWTPTMRVAANWFPLEHRGRAIGIVGTGYQLCGALTFVVAGWAAHYFGWRGALYVPAALLVASALHMLFLLEESPDKVGGQTRGENAASTMNSAASSAQRNWRENLMLTLSNPALWLVGAALCLLDACRYGFTDWGVKHLTEVLGGSVKDSAFKYAVLPFGGIAGAYLSGLATDRFFGGRRAPVICLLLLALGFLGVAYNSVIHHGLLASVAILFCIGLCIFGAQVLLVGTLPVDLARCGTAAAAVGFVNFMGYMGAAAGDKFTGHLAQDYGWQKAVFFWAACAFVAAAIIACLWNVKAQAEGSGK